MSSSNESFRSSFSYDEVVAMARWYKEDLEKGGWRVIHERPGSKMWIKTFPKKKVPIKVLMEFDLPMSAEQFKEVYSPKNMEYRLKWDKAFVDNEILEEYPNNGGYIFTNRLETSWPLTDRDFVLFQPVAKEIDWYDKRAFLTSIVNAWHPLKPANASGYVRATNGGNFYISIPDENDPENACRVFAMSHNNYNGWMPNRHIEWLLARKVPASFIVYFDNMIEGCKMMFGN